METEQKIYHRKGNYFLNFHPGGFVKKFDNILTI